MTPGQHLPPEYDKGDETTVGGYAAVHSRPAALEGRDGMSYSLDLLSDSTGEAARTCSSPFLTNLQPEALPC